MHFQNVLRDSCTVENGSRRVERSACGAETGRGERGSGRGMTRTNVRSNCVNEKDEEKNGEKEREGRNKQDSPRAPCPSSCLLGRVNQRARRRIIIPATLHMYQRRSALRSLRALCSTVSLTTRTANAQDLASEIVRHAHNHTDIANMSLS